jgi:hypothetical protein
MSSEVISDQRFLVVGLPIDLLYPLMMLNDHDSRCPNFYSLPIFMYASSCFSRKLYDVNAYKCVSYSDRYFQDAKGYNILYSV